MKCLKNKLFINSSKKKLAFKIETQHKQPAIAQAFGSNNHWGQYSDLLQAQHSVRSGRCVAITKAVVPFCLGASLENCSFEPAEGCALR